MSPRTSPRVVATDLDGTLLRSDGSVSLRSVAALRLAEEAGAVVVFVTGRPPRGLAPVQDALGSHGLAICLNGAMVYDALGRRIVEQEELSAETAMKVAHALREDFPGVTFAIERGCVYGKEPLFPRRVPLPEGGFEAELEELLAAPVAKLVAQDPSVEPAEFVGRGICAVGGLTTATFPDYRALLEISALGVSKASALAKFCADLGVGPEQVVAFGDMPNDLLMLEWAGTSFAMADAHPDAVRAADLRCGGNDDDGVAQVLERLFG
ncbi:HAD family hydrolase [Phytoactinopolyspora endophytica]|uniref:HAD family hydrolase n=1 Tax=Phytoactinopolyspora endophytica TaxID=1642495 RepID=UPI00101BF61D|nr:HAD family hydrolase [Phytoactinopolyspora endophytica]